MWWREEHWGGRQGQDKPTDPVSQPGVEMLMEMVDMEVELVMNMDKETGTKDERNRSTTSPAMMR